MHNKIFRTAFIALAALTMLLSTTGCAPASAEVDLSSPETAVVSFFEALRQGDARRASACMADNEDILGWTADGLFLPMMKQTTIEIKGKQEQGRYRAVTVSLSGPDYAWITMELKKNSKNMAELARLAQEYDGDEGREQLGPRMENLYRRIEKEYIKYISDGNTPKSVRGIIMLTRFSPRADGWVIERETDLLDELVGRAALN
ncbi:MAG: hypothetical protein FWD16_03645 [Clostridia bacterium]|nr:hypothetical protein [Clostridia bacterium]